MRCKRTVSRFTESDRPYRLFVKEFVAGVATDDVAKAFSFSRFNDKSVVNDQVNDLLLMAVFDQDSVMAAVFSRVVRRLQSAARW